jgi:hypothetical protein
MNKYYHTDKRCLLKKYTIARKGYTAELKGQWCKTHKKFICKCGWEFGWHYGIESKNLL